MGFVCYYGKMHFCKFWSCNWIVSIILDLTWQSTALSEPAHRTTSISLIWSCSFFIYFWSFPITFAEPFSAGNLMNSCCAILPMVPMSLCYIWSYMHARYFWMWATIMFLIRWAFSLFCISLAISIVRGDFWISILWVHSSAALIISRDWKFLSVIYWWNTTKNIKKQLSKIFKLMYMYCSSMFNNTG